MVSKPRSKAGPKKTSDASTDGRHARSERSREAVVEALLAILEEGNLKPKAEDIAARAGLSRRLLFHHFRDLEDLLGEAAKRQLERVLPLVAAFPFVGTLEERVRGFAETASSIYERVAPVRRAALLAEPTSTAVASNLRDGRERHRGLVEAVFAPELAAAPPERRAILDAALVAASSFPAWNELAQLGVTPEQRAAAMETTLAALLAQPHDSKR